MKKLDFSDWTVCGAGLLISILGLAGLCSGAWWHAITLIGGIAMLCSTVHDFIINDKTKTS